MSQTTVVVIRLVVRQVHGPQRVRQLPIGPQSTTFVANLKVLLDLPLQFVKLLQDHLGDLDIRLSPVEILERPMNIPLVLHHEIEEATNDRITFIANRGD